MKGKLIAVRTEEGVSIHADHYNGTYDTLCGMDANDPNIGHLGTVDLPKHAKLDCPSCIAIIEKSKEYRTPKQK